MSASEFALSPVDRSNAYESVQRQLLRMVVSGSSHIGDKLPSEQQMARGLGVSRPVIREALGSLRALGLIDSRKGRGSFIVSTTPLSLPKRFSMYDLIEARSLIEVPMAQLAARRGSPEVVTEMAAAVDSMGTTSDGRAWEDQDAVFHAALARASGNSVLMDLSRRVHRDLLNEMGITLRSDGRIKQANREHREICDAVSEGDEERAAQAVAAHLGSILEEAVDAYGDEPLEAPQ